MKNGRDPHWDDPKITSISAARKKAADSKKQQIASAAPRRSIAQWLFGALVIAMAMGMLLNWTKPLWQGSVSFAP